MAAEYLINQEDLSKNLILGMAIQKTVQDLQKAERELITLN